ncbi:hypothetical protein [Pseudonocardia sp.]|uniref:hypothetical protein n=1 Tax=Pseudonocardia sp. TaxID=60912 RepID=UPI003D110DF9
MTDSGDGPHRVVAVLAPAGVYLGVRLVGIVVLAVMSARNGTSLLEELTSWDGEWLLEIAAHGYDGVSDQLVDAYGNRDGHTALGFFPGYPGLVAPVAPVTGTAAAGLLVVLAAGIAAAYGMARLGELVPGGSRRAGLILVALFAATPMAVVLSMAYSEALFCALAAWALVALLQERWLLAGVLTAVAGLVRPTATGLIAAVGLAAVATAVTGREVARSSWNVPALVPAGRHAAGPPAPAAVATSQRLAALAAAVVAPLGWLAWLGFVAYRTGELDGWFRIQREGWGWYPDATATPAWVLATLGHDDRAYQIATAVVLVAALVLLVLTVVARLPWPLVVYAAAGLVPIWGTQGLMNTKVRLLIPVFVLLIPVALGLSRRGTATVVAVLAGVALASAWFGGFALTVWPYGI